MQKKLVIIILFVLVNFTNNLLAQTNITGKVLADKTNAVVANATVQLLSAIDSTVKKLAITNNDGNYELENITNGEYFITISSVGYKTKNTNTFKATGGSLNIETTTLTVSNNSLETVTVVGAKKKPLIEVRADKMVFNVEGSINATGSNGYELLQKSPGVVMDKDENITLKGKNGVRVYIDGRQQQMDGKDLASFLKSLNSADIEAIEIITNPSAKYDAAGNAGIINIRLKKNKKLGYSGNISAGLNIGKTPKTNYSTSINYRKNIVSLFANYSNNWGNNEGNINLFRTQSDSIYQSKNKNIDKGWNHNIKGGIDIQAGKNSSIGYAYTGSFFKGSWFSDGVTPISGTATKSIGQILYATNDIAIKRNNTNMNFNFRNNMPTGESFNIDLDFGKFKSTANSYQPNLYKTPITNILITQKIYTNNTPTDIDIFTTKVDYEKPVLKTSKLGYGAKLSDVKTSNIFDFYDNIAGVNIKDLNRSNSFKYTEKVYAAYTNWNQSIDSTWTIQAGIRVENTASEGILKRADGVVQTDGVAKRNYINVFPSAAVTKIINPKNSITLTYSRRIDRPSYQDLNPFENKLDELTFQKGNAFLRPQYTNSFELTHTFMGFLNTTLGYAHVKDYSTQILDTTERNKSFITSKNLATQDVITLNIGAPFGSKNGKFNSYINFSGNHSKFNADFGPAKKINLKATSFNVYMQHSYNFGKGFTTELSGWYASPGIWGGTFKSKGIGNLDLGVQQTLMNNKMTVKFTYTDLLYTNKWAGLSNFGGTIIDANGNYESQQFRVNLSYRFGSSNIKSNQRAKGSEDEAKRIKSGSGGFGN